MKHKLIRSSVLLLLLIFNAAAFAQVIEGFESGVPSAPSTPTDVTLSSGVWTLYKSGQTATKHSGSYGLQINSGSSDSSSATAPVMNSVGTVSFWGKCGSAGSITILKSVNGSSFSVVSAQAMTSTYTSYTVTVNETSDKVRIRFRNGQGTSMYIDDVSITNFTSPFLRLSTVTIPSFNLIVAGSSSASVAYTVEGVRLTDTLHVIAPKGFQVSTDNTVFSASLGLLPVSGSVPVTTIYARFAPSEAFGSTAGVISHRSTGAATLEVAVDGKAIGTEPVVQSAISFSDVSGNSMKVNFSGGSGSNRILVIKAGSAVSRSPADGKDVSGINSDFGKALDQGSGNKVVFAGADAGVTITGLTVASAYYFAVYEYNGSVSGSENYLLTAPGTGNQTTLAVPGLNAVPSSLAFGDVPVNATSKEKSYSVSGKFLSPSDGSITVSAPPGFEISSTSGTGYSLSVNIPYSGGTLNSTTVYVRFKPVVVSVYSDVIIQTGGGAPAVNVSVTGNGKDLSSFITRGIFCSPDGNDVTATGTYDDPFYSLSKAVALAIPGDTIWMHGGTYKYKATVFLSKAGTAALPFSIIAYPGEKPVLDWSDWKPANESERGNARGIKVTTSAKYWYLKKLDICYAPDNGVKCEGGHTTFEQCFFHHNGDSGLQVGLGKDSLSANPDPENFAAYTRVINCDATRNADPGTDYENADGFACKLYAGKGNYFYGCRSYENVDDGWDCYQTEYEIVIERCWSWHNGDPAIWGFTSFNGDGNGFKLGGNGTPCPITIKNCVAFDAPFGAMCAFNDNNNGDVITVLNCTAWAGGKDFKMQSKPHVLKNCIAFDPKSGAKFTRDLSSSAISVNNTWDLTALTADYDDFVSTSAADALAPREPDGSLPNNGFAKLRAGSDMIDKGVDVGIPFIGPAPDLGAYEFDPGVDVVKHELKASTFSLEQKYPNPFNPSTIISYQLPVNSLVTLKVYSILGKEIATLLNEGKPAGEHQFIFNASFLPSGVYLYSLKAGNYNETRKMLLIK